MSRLLQGDVGSGKTVVAAAAMLMAVAAGKQAALMAPTEILAEQHHQTIAELLANAEDWGLDRPDLGRAAHRQPAPRGARQGLYRPGFGRGGHCRRHPRPDPAARDLQRPGPGHRRRAAPLWRAQRAALRSKGSAPHMLVMSATPIPRSLALTVYGDLDVSVIDELPPGRQPIETRWLLPRERERAYASCAARSSKGRQAFILYPLVEESDKVEAKAAVEEYERLQADHLSRSAAGAAPRPDEGQGKRRGDDPLSRGRDQTSWSPPRWSRWASTCPTPRSC